MAKAAKGAQSSETTKKQPAKKMSGGRVSKAAPAKKALTAKGKNALKSAALHAKDQAVTEEDESMDVDEESEDEETPDEDSEEEEEENIKEHPKEKTHQTLADRVLEISKIGTTADPGKKLNPKEKKALEAFKQYIRKYNEGLLPKTVSERLPKDWKRSEGGKIENGLVMNKNCCIVERLTKRQESKLEDFSKCPHVKYKEPAAKTSVSIRIADLNQFINMGIPKSQEKNIRGIIKTYEEQGYIEPLKGELEDQSVETYWYDGKQIDALKAITMQTLDEVWMEPKSVSNQSLIELSAKELRLEDDSSPHVIHVPIPTEKDDEESGLLEDNALRSARAPGPQPRQPVYHYVHEPSETGIWNYTRADVLEGQALDADGNVITMLDCQKSDRTVGHRFWIQKAVLDYLAERLPQIPLHRSPELADTRFDRDLVVWKQKPRSNLFIVEVALRYPPASSTAVYDPSDPKLIPRAVTVEMAFDTGSTHPSISQEVVDLLDAQQTPTGPAGIQQNFITASGETGTMTLRKIQWCILCNGNPVTDWYEGEFGIPDQFAQQEWLRTGLNPPRKVLNLLGFTGIQAMHFMIPKHGQYLLGFNKHSVLADAYAQGLIDLD